MNKMVLLLGLLLVFGFQSSEGNTPPEVTNVLAAQQAHTGLVDITYDLNDIESDSLFITLLYSLDGGASFENECITVWGDVGSGVPTGPGRTATWDAATDVPDYQSEDFVIRVYADDSGGSAGSWIDDFTSFNEAQYMLFGTDENCAIWDQASQAFRLVYDQIWVGGRIVFDEMLPSTSFVASFDFKVAGTHNSDGLIFVWTLVPDSPIGIGGSLDWNVDAQGFGVEIDFYGGGNDPTYSDHVSLGRDGINNIEAWAYLPGGDYSLDDGNWHSLQVMNTSGNLVVFIDDVQALSHQILDYNMPEAYFRISATTGTFSGNVWIDNVNVSGSR